jgi:ribosome maturation factor RimP
VTGHQPNEALLEVLTGPLEASGVDLEGVEISTAGRRRLVRVLVDKDAGITLDDVADATQLVSSVLDSSDVLGEASYTLEVTSPGIDRPLTLPRHWRRNVDRLVKVQTVHGQSFTGRIKHVGEAEASVEVDGADRTLAYDDVAKARIEIEFNRPRSSKPRPESDTLRESDERE